MSANASLDSTDSLPSPRAGRRRPSSLPQRWAAGIIRVRIGL
mgnify:CR=1 FL=1